MKKTHRDDGGGIRWGRWILATSLVGAVLLFGIRCQNPEVAHKERWHQYTNALHRTASPGEARFDKSALREQAVARFTNFYAHLANETYLRREATNVYAREAYFDDTVKILNGGSAIGAYLAGTAKNLTSAEVAVQEIFQNGSSVYVRWHMTFRTASSTPDYPVHSTGITLLRMDESGKVIFHRDFWDASNGLYKHLPVSGPAIRFIEQRL